MDEKLYQDYVNILREELVPAMGCTEPIAIAYAAALAGKTLGTVPEKLDVCVSGNIIKNVKGVKVPNSNGLKGIDVAATLGVVGGRADNLDVVYEQGIDLVLPICRKPMSLEEALGMQESVANLACAGEEAARAYDLGRI